MKFRGPHIPIVVVLVILFLDYTTYRRTIDWEWPFERWTMYEGKADIEPIANYRRVLAHDNKGKSFPIDLGRAFGFLGKPYRYDRGIKKSVSSFLRKCLDAVRENEGPHIIGLTFEKRSWHYQETTLEKHLASELPYKRYTVIAVEQPPAALRPHETSDSNLLANGRFKKIRRSGKPRNWSLEGGASLGIGVDFDTDNKAALLTRSPTPQELYQVVALPSAHASSPIEFHLRVLVRAAGPGASVQLIAASPSGEAVRRHEEAKGDGVWHPITIDGVLATATKDTEVKVVLGNSGKADVYFDDAVLTVAPRPEPAPAGDTPAAPRLGNP